MKTSNSNPFRAARNPSKDIAARLYDIKTAAERDKLLGVEHVATALDHFTKQADLPAEKQRKPEQPATETPDESAAPSAAPSTAPPATGRRGSTAGQ